MKTIINLFESCTDKYPDNPYLWDKKKDTYISLSYKETKELVYQFAAGLIALGVKKGDRIVLISEGRSEWVIAELGILYAGAINVPLSIKLEELSEIKFRIEHSEARYIIASRNQAKKIKQLKGQLPLVEKHIMIDDDQLLFSDEVYYKDILINGLVYLRNNLEGFNSTWKSASQNDYANICYSSGTTADPKGIILSHRNYTANVEQACSLIKIPSSYSTLVILPLDHAFAHTACIYIFMAYGASIGFVQLGRTPMETLKNIPANIKELKPEIILSVPALAKNFRKNIEKGIRDKGKLIEILFNHALKVAYAHNGNGWDKPKGIQFINGLLYSIYKKIIFNKIKENFGGQLDFFVGGGAYLDIELQRFFYALGIPMFQGYGLSEAAPIISANSPLKHKLGTSGYIAKDLELKICDEKGIELPLGKKGEIVIRGENVMIGYWKNEKATAETIKDGWLYTGDLGWLDQDGFLYVQGRYKSLLIANDGEKYSPEGIEEAYVENSHFIDQCMLYNNQKPFTVALIVPNQGPILHYLREKGLSPKSEEGQKAALLKIQKELDQYKPGGKFEGLFATRWLPASIAILDEPFSEQNQQLNSTMKMVRGKITKNYKELIETLYNAEGKDITNPRNKAAIERFGSN